MMTVLVMNRKHAALFRRYFATLAPRVVDPLPTGAIPSFSLDRRVEEALTGRFVSVLRSCSGSGDLQRGKQVHAQSVVRGISRSGLLGPKLLGMYVLCGDLLDAKECFYRLEEAPGSAPWNWMIRGLAELGWFDLALSFYFKMLGCGIYPDRYTSPYVIKACQSLSKAVSYNLVHGMIDLMGVEVDAFVASSVIKFYAENGCIADARNMFDKMPRKDCVLCNVMLNGYLKNGDSKNAVGVFLEMRKGEIKPNSITFAGILSACALEGMIGLGAQLHSLAFRCGLESDSPVASTLLAMYSKCQYLNEASKLFDLMLQHDVVTWNALISGYVQNGLMGEALLSFIEMLNHGVKPDSVTFSSLLPSITESANLRHAKEVHGENGKMTVLVMNRKHAALFRRYFAMLAPRVVDPLPTGAIPSFSLDRRVEEALTGCFVSVLRSCSGSGDLQRGKQVHAQSVVRGFSRSSLLGPKLLGMYVLCGDLLDAKECFYRLEEAPGSAPWNWMIRGLAELGWFDLALSFYFKMLGCGIYPDRYTSPYVIKACQSLSKAVSYNLVHGMIDLMGVEVDAFVASSVIKFYAENGCIADARNMFDKMPRKDCVLCNVMLNGYLKNGDSKNAVGVFLEMRKGEIKPNSITFAGILSACALEGMIGLGAQLHSLAFRCGLESDSPVANTLLAMYSKCQYLNEASKLFDLMLQHDVVTWNALISGYVQNGLMGEALLLFIEMLNHGVKPDSVTFSSLLPSITESANLRHAKEVHGYVMRNGVPLDVFLKSALINVYFKCRNVKLAYNVFKQETISHDVVIYTAMISGFVLNGMNSDAIEIFRLLLDRKVNPNPVTLASILPACAGLASLRLGKELHGFVLKSALDGRCFVLSAIIDMYAKCGQLGIAHQIFRSMSEKDVVCWNSMITNFSQNGKPEVAIQLFREMGLNGIKYDNVSISSALSACASLPALYHGKEIHGYMTRCVFCHDIYAETALIDMYAKCGHLEFARHVFDMVDVKNEVSWNSMIAAYGSHGLLRECVSLFYEMQDNGIQPDDVTFLTIISACGHAGQIDKGIEFFHCMTEKYGIRAKMEHFACMIDLFGRAGRLDEAFKTIKCMPFSPDAGVWGTLLGACHLYGNLDLAEVASTHLFQMEPQNSGYYVLFSNLHAGAGHLDGVIGARSLMKERGVKKVPGRSWIEVDNKTHVFVAADEAHLRSAHIYSMLEILLLELRKEDYVTQQYLTRHPQAEWMT